jgi:hypothetical protein
MQGAVFHDIIYVYYKKGTVDMKIMSSYAMKLNGDLTALDGSITIYREALHFIIPIVNTHWDEMKDFEYGNQRMVYTEKLIHSTKVNHALYNFEKKEKAVNLITVFFLCIKLYEKKDIIFPDFLPYSLPISNSYNYSYTKI